MHQLVDRPGRDLDVGTDSDIPMEDISAAIVAGLTARGWDIQIVGVDPRSARMTATDPATVSSANWTSSRKSSTSPGSYAIRSGPRPL